MSKNATPRTQRASHKIRYLILGVIGLFILLAIGFFAYTKTQSINEANKKYPLGSQLEYIGQVGYGCWLICDANPNSTYYYATDLSVVDVTRYFTKSTIDDRGNLNSQNSPNIPITFSLKSPNGKVFYITYYTEGQTYARKSGFSPKQHHLVTLLRGQYSAAKDSL